MSFDYLSDLIGRMGQWAYLLIFVGAALMSADSKEINNDR